MTHTSEPTLRARGAAVFGVTMGTVDWPYEASGIPPRSDPNFEEHRARVEHTRLMMVDWAESYGLTASTIRCCPAWLTRAVSRRCTSGCTMFGGGAVDHRWLEHEVLWVKDGRPAVLTSSPYGISDEANRRIGWWMGRHPMLRVATGPGWYMPMSTQVVMWNAERIREVRPSGT